MSAIELLVILLFVALAFVLYFVFASFAYGAGYQPTPARIVEGMLDAAEVGPNDFLVDLGAGTGAIVFRAARERGARTLAVEVEPIRVGILHLRRAVGGPRDRVTICRGNLFATDFRSATVVAVFLWPSAMERLRPILEAQLPHGARLVSYWHPVPGWTESGGRAKDRIYLYRR